MNGEQIVRAAIPNASAELIEHIIWGRTPFPVGAITARSLYKAASSFKRASDKGIALCDFCDNKANPNGYLCDSCQESLNACRIN